jgi:hypothetical protein
MTMKDYLKFLENKMTTGLGMVACTCNPRYLKGSSRGLWVQGQSGQRQWDLSQKLNIKQKDWGMSQVVGRIFA